MQSPANKVAMAEMNAAIDKALAYTLSPKSEREQLRTQRKDRHPSSIKEAKASYKTDNR